MADEFLEGGLDNFIDARDRDDLQFLAHVFGNIFQIGFVARGQNDPVNPGSMRGQNFSLMPPTGNTNPDKVISPVIAVSGRTRRPV